MSETRRNFLGLAGAAALAAVASKPALASPDSSSGSTSGLGERILQLFQALPGTKALKMVSPGAGHGRDFQVAMNPDAALFCASAFKGFVLAEFLRLVEAGEATLAELLPVDDSVWSLGAPVLTPWPGAVTGQITARTVLEAMIAHSDNTATDIALKRVGADRVRSFISSIGLHNARIPDSTRQFFGYVFGYPQWQTITWEKELELLDTDPTNPHPIINNVQTMAISPNDFVSFYSRALQGAFFSQPGMLTTFRAILSQADAIALAMPLGVNAFLKGGSIDFNGQHALSLAGGMFVPARRWVYFAFISNWTDAQGGTVQQETPRFASVSLQMFTALRDAFATCR